MRYREQARRATRALELIRDVAETTLQDIRGESVPMDPDVEPEPPVVVDPPTNTGSVDLSDLRALSSMGRTWPLLPFNETARGLHDGREFIDVRSPIGDRGAFFNSERKEAIWVEWRGVRIDEEDEGAADWWGLHLFGVDGLLHRAFIHEVGDNQKEGHPDYTHCGPTGFTHDTFYYLRCGGNSQRMYRSMLRYTSGGAKLGEVLDWTGTPTFVRRNGLIEDCGWRHDRGSFPIQSIMLGQPDYLPNEVIDNVHVRCAWDDSRAIQHKTLGELRSRGGAIFQGSAWATERGVREFGTIEIKDFTVETLLPDREYLVVQNAEEVIVRDGCRFISEGRPTRIWFGRNWFTNEDKVAQCGHVVWPGCESENVELWVGLNGDKFDPREPHVFDNGKRVPRKLGQAERMEVE